MAKEELIVDGFLFVHKKEAQMALRELSNIKTIKTKTDFNDKNALLELYNKLIEKELFKTVVGINFLSDIRKELLKDNYCRENELPAISIDSIFLDDQQSKGDVEDIKLKLSQLEKVNKRLLIAVISMSILILGIVVFLGTNQNVGYINTENKILSKYSGWQQELEEREAAIEQKEAELSKE